MLIRVVHFLRPTFVALIALALIVGIREVVGVATNSPSAAAGGATDRGLSGLRDVDLSGIVMPSPSLTPDQVVRLQLAGLGSPRADGVGVLQCFVLASPGNRSATGPLDRFGKMVRRRPFHCLASPRAYLIGQPHIVRRTARVLVTIVDQQEQVHAFTFVLGRQAQRPFADCWMTEAVWPSLPAPVTEAAPSA